MIKRNLPKKELILAHGSSRLESVEWRTERKGWHADRSRKLPNVFVQAQEAVITNSK